MTTAMRQIRRVAHHVGRRGAFLLFLTLLDVVLGFALTQPLPYGLSARVFYQPFVSIMPLGLWAAWWLATGCMTAVAAVWHRARPATFAAASLIKTAWGLGYLIGWAGGQAAFTRGYLGAATFLAFAAIVLTLAGWRENGQ